jgi:hypothetical protein
MIGCVDIKFGSMELEQFFPKVVIEGWIMVRENRVGHSMKFEDIIHENLSHYGCCERVLEGIEMSIFGKVIDYDNDD